MENKQLEAQLKRFLKFLMDRSVIAEGYNFERICDRFEEEVLK